ncbi:MAG: TPM domain-containing protein [Burkholderiaceae bacterium]
MSPQGRFGAWVAQTGLRAVAARRWLAAIVASICLGASGAAAGQGVLPVPPLSGRVIDQTATLSPAQQQALEAKLAAFESRRGSQLVVLIVSSTAPEDIAAYAQRIAETWKIGRPEVGDGLLIVVAKDDRRVNIQTAKALEGAVPDLAARQIIDTALRPAFRAGDYAGGLHLAIDALIARIEGESLPAVQTRQGAPGGPFAGLFGDWQLSELLIFAFVALPIVAGITRRWFGRGLGSLVSGVATGTLAWWVSHITFVAVLGGLVGLLFGLFAGASRSLRSGGHHGAWGGGFSGGGGGGFSSGGGGFSSGGGGDFGGGGASGDW